MRTTAERIGDYAAVVTEGLRLLTAGPTLPGFPPPAYPAPAAATIPPSPPSISPLERDQAQK